MVVRPAFAGTRIGVFAFRNGHVIAYLMFVKYKWIFELDHAVYRFWDISSTVCWTDPFIRLKSSMTAVTAHQINPVS